MLAVVPELREVLQLPEAELHARFATESVTLQEVSNTIEQILLKRIHWYSLQRELIMKQGRWQWRANNARTLNKGFLDGADV